MSVDHKQSDITHTNVEDAYARWAPIYDRVFTAVMKPGRLAAAEALNRVGGRILDVGVGTGLELPMFSGAKSIVGIDLSAPMLEIGRKRVAELGLKNVESLLVMDAMNLEFPDASAFLYEQFGHGFLSRRVIDVKCRWLFRAMQTPR